MSIRLVKVAKTFEGETRYYEHDSKATKTKMNFSVFVPKSEKIKNAIIWLSGLTCTEDNFITKAGAQKYLRNTNTMIICPDTSPRGLNLPGEHESYDFGSGAGFYVNAKSEGYNDHYNMYDYIAIEIVEILKNDFNVQKISIMGHSMGGHGALVLGLREQKVFSSVSAFSPIVNPLKSPWGQKALKGYLGVDHKLWNNYDATQLVHDGYKSGSKILIEQGLDDEFLEKELLTENFVKVCREKGQELEVNYREGYDHSYFFISTFIGDHIQFHLKSF